VGELTTTLVTADDAALFAGIHALVADGVRRGEPLGYVVPPTRDDYRHAVGSLLDRSKAINGGVFAAVLDGRVVGTAEWLRSSYATRRVLADLDKVAVHPDARGSGVGRRVVEATLADAATHGVEVVTLEVRGNNHGAIALYERCGFTRAGLVPNAVADGADRFDLVLMVRELPRPAGLRMIGSDPIGAGALPLRTP
jgi:ribosomal protein S18 acetylase RimI-like enzyme